MTIGLMSLATYEALTRALIEQERAEILARALEETAHLHLDYNLTRDAEIMAMIRDEEKLVYLGHDFDDRPRPPPRGHAPYHIRNDHPTSPRRRK